MHQFDKNFNIKTFFPFLMIKLKGVGVSAGIVFGTAFVFIPKLEYQNIKSEFKSADFEIKRFRNALSETKKNVEKIRDKLVEQGLKEAGIFDAHILILEDEEFISSVESLILSKKLVAEEAIRESIKKFSKNISSVKSEYVSGRSKDVEDLGEQLIKNLTSVSEKGLSELSEQSIIVARDLRPSDTANLNRRMVLGFITEEGSPISHVSILARALKIPAIVKCSNIINSVKDGDKIIMNGSTGDVFIDPDEETILYYKRYLSAEDRKA
jgi:phosphotransferase system enzyme I (PtsI)